MLVSLVIINFQCVLLSSPVQFDASYFQVSSDSLAKLSLAHVIRVDVLTDHVNLRLCGPARDGHITFGQQGRDKGYIAPRHAITASPPPGIR